MSETSNKQSDSAIKWRKEAFNSPIGDTGDWEGCIEIWADNRSVAMCWNPDDQNEEDFNRIIQCVNACARIADPEKAIQAMREAIKEAHAALSRLDDCRIFYAESMDIDNYTTDDCATARAKLKPFLS